MKNNLKVSYTHGSTKVSLEYGLAEFKFEIEVGSKSMNVDATQDEIDELKRRIDFNEFDWKNIMWLEILCKTYYIIITEDNG